jgi:nitrous oxide reductase accessory protein NosL
LIRSRAEGALQCPVKHAKCDFELRPENPSSKRAVLVPDLHKTAAWGQDGSQCHSSIWIKIRIVNICIVIEFQRAVSSSVG